MLGDVGVPDQLDGRELEEELEERLLVSCWSFYVICVFQTMFSSVNEFKFYLVVLVYCF